MNVGRTAYLILTVCSLGTRCICQGLDGEAFVRRLPEAYVPGKTITVSLNFPYPYIADWTSFYGFVQETIPAGWSLEWSNITPTGFSEQSGTIYWRFEFWCTFRISIRYYVTPPPGEVGEVSFDGFCFSSRTGPNHPPFFYAPTAGDTTLTGRVGVARLVPQQYPTPRFICISSV